MKEEAEDRLKLVRTLLLSISVLVGFTVFNSEVSTWFLYTFIMSSLFYYALIVNRGPQNMILWSAVGISASFSIFNFYLLKNNGLEDLYTPIILSAVTFPIGVYALKPTTVSLTKSVCGLTRILDYIPYLSFRKPQGVYVKKIRRVQVKINNRVEEKLYDNW